MTLVIRITLSFLAAITVVSLTSDADAQLFRRLRENIRTTYPQQAPVAPQPQRSAPVQPQGQTGRSLTPYSRLTPEQRRASANAQAVPKANPNANSDQVNVRVVTYYDPRTGRTFQRRFIIPPNNDATGQVGNKQLAGGNAPKTQPTQAKKRNYDKIPRPVAVNPPQQVNARPSIAVQPQPKSVIPSISVNQVQAPIQKAPVPSQQLPLLAGPSSIMSATPAATPPIYIEPAIQVPTQQEITLPSVAIANGQDVGSEIVIDTAVAPATANSEGNDTANNIGSIAADAGAPIAFSVLEKSDDDVSAKPADFDIEIGSADEVEAFFGE